jgi:type IV secretory pathway VirB4 component
MQAGAVHAAPHQRLVFTDTATDFLPLYQSAGGDGRPLFLAQTRNGEPYTIDIAAPSRTNWNSFVLGQSGGGKTFLALSFVTSSMLGLNSPLIVIDVGGREEGSYYRLVQLLGGDFVDVGLDGKNAINAFYSRADLYTDDETELPSDKPSPRKTLFLVQIAALLVTDPGEKPLGTVQLGILEKAILATYERLGDSRPPLFSDLVAELEAMKLERDDKQDARRFAKTIRAWVEGPYGQVLNQQSKVNIRSSFVVFDLKGLEDVGRIADVILLIITTYVWNLVAKPRGGALAWVVFDEVWKMMQNEMAANMQRELFKTARKLRTGLVSITQELADFLATPAARTVVAQSTSVYVLPHREGHDQVAALLKLNERERTLFEGGPGTPGLTVEKGLYSEFLYRTGGPPARSAVLRHVTTPAEYWLNTTDGQDKTLEQSVLAEMGGDRLATLRRLMRDYPNGSHQPSRRSSDV